MFDIVSNKLCILCKDKAEILLKPNQNDYECKNCKIFYGGMDYEPEMIFIGFEHVRNLKKIVIMIQKDKIKTYHSSNIRVENINLQIDKIPETIEELDSIYNQVKKINIFS